MLHSLVTVDVIAVGLIKWGCMCSYTLASGEGRMANKTLLITYMLLLELNSSVPAALGARNPTEFSKSHNHLPVAIYYLVQEEAVILRVIVKNTSSNSFDLLPFVLKFVLQVNMLNTSFTLGGEERGSGGYIGRGQKDEERSYVTYILVNTSCLFWLGWYIKMIQVESWLFVSRNTKT